VPEVALQRVVDLEDDVADVAVSNQCAGAGVRPEQRPVPLVAARRDVNLVARREVLVDVGVDFVAGGETLLTQVDDSPVLARCLGAGTAE